MLQRIRRCHTGHLRTFQLRECKKVVVFVKNTVTRMKIVLLGVPPTQLIIYFFGQQRYNGFQTGQQTQIMAQHKQRNSISQLERRKFMSSHVIFALFLTYFNVLFTLLSHYFMDRDVIMGSRLNMDTDHWKPAQHFGTSHSNRIRCTLLKFMYCLCHFISFLNFFQMFFFPLHSPSYLKFDTCLGDCN